MISIQFVKGMQQQQPQIAKQISKPTKQEKVQNKNKKSKKNQCEKKIFCKDDISLPKNGVHIAHVGLNDPMNEQKLSAWNTYLEKFVSEKELRDTDTLNFIYGFLEYHEENNTHQPERNVNIFH